MALRTDYKDDILDTRKKKKRVYNLIDQSGNVVMSGLSLEDVTVYSQVGDEFSSSAVNEAFDNINNRNLKTYTSLSQLGLSANTATYDEVLNALPDGSELMIYVTQSSFPNMKLPKTGGFMLHICKAWITTITLYDCGSGGIYTMETSGSIVETITASGKWKRAMIYTPFIGGTLKAGQTSIVITDTAINTGSTFDFYTSIYGVSPVTAPIVTDGSITLEFDAQETDMNVEVRVM